MAVTTKNIASQAGCKYEHLNTFERGQIFILNQEGYRMRSIASRLGQSASTISRELRRGAVICPHF